jgi:hypothetical protein
MIGLQDDEVRPWQGIHGRPGGGGSADPGTHRHQVLADGIRDGLKAMQKEWKALGAPTWHQAPSSKPPTREERIDTDVPAILSPRCGFHQPSQKAQILDFKISDLPCQQYADVLLTKKAFGLQVGVSNMKRRASRIV